MGCVYLLGTAEFKSRNQVGRCHPHVLFHTDFHATFYPATAESFTEIGHDQKKVAWFNVETEDHLWTGSLQGIWQLWSIALLSSKF